VAEFRRIQATPAPTAEITVTFFRPPVEHKVRLRPWKDEWGCERSRRRERSVDVGFLELQEMWRQFGIERQKRIRAAPRARPAKSGGRWPPFCIAPSDRMDIARTSILLR